MENNEQTTETKNIGTHKQKIANEEQVESTEQKTSVQLKPKFVPSSDALENKKIAWLSYILFFIPLLINAKSAFVRHHANEGLEINIFDVIGLTLLLIGTLVKTSITYFHAMLLIFVLVGTGLLVLTTITKIYMIVSTLQGKEQSTPWMWKLRIIK